jgi:hypothetical protein
METTEFENFSITSTPPPKMICDTCSYEMFDHRNMGDRVL